MKKFLFSFLLALSLSHLPAHSAAPAAFDQNHSKWTQILASHLNEKGLFSYQKLAEEMKSDSQHPFSLYLQELQTVQLADFERWSRDEQMAFLINAYNAFTVKLILDHFPLTSIKKVGGFFTKPWKIEFFSLLGGKIKSLDPIEHEWLRPKFKDYRIHAAVNCASISCPPLRREAYVPNRLQNQLEDQMKTWLKDPSRNDLNLKDQTFTISKIFDWYKEDFTSWGGGVVQVISHHALPSLTKEAMAKIKVKYLDYNWDLNEAK